MGKPNGGARKEDAKALATRRTLQIKGQTTRPDEPKKRAEKIEKHNPEQNPMNRRHLSMKRKNAIAERTTAK